MPKMLDGVQKVEVRSPDGSTPVITSTNGDGFIVTNKTLLTTGYNMVYNGTTWDRQRGNTEGLLLSNTSRTGNTSTAIQTNHNAKGVVLAIDITQAHATETLKLNLQAHVNGVATWAFAGYDIPTNTVGKFFLMVYPGIELYSGTATRVKSNAYVLPRSWYANIAHSGSGEWKYSVHYSVIN